MHRTYETHNEITCELLDTIKRGDLVRCNDWVQPLRVVATTDNYFVMSRNMFGKVLYSVCDKRPAPYTRNCFDRGEFRIGADNFVFGAPGGYDWADEQQALAYLDMFERGECELSERGALSLYRIKIKREEATP